MTPPPSRPLISGVFADRLFGWLAKGAALFTLGLLLAILGSLIYSAWPAITEYGLGSVSYTHLTLPTIYSV